MTPEQIARALGEQLLVQRTRRKLSPRAIQRRGGPSAPTVEAIDTGDLGVWDSLVKYCAALDVSLEEVLKNVLAPAPLSVDEQQLVRLFAALPLETRGLVLQIVREFAREPRK